ncbi:MAG TPA: PhoU family transcriptional regulator [Desulfomicrobium sp.]|nr:PhoU family transcriptional regulator [Desulfomicrobium sp.]
MHRHFEGLDENFRFLILEVQNQIKATIEFLLAPTPGTYDKIINKDDYIDNLKNVIENTCFTTLSQTKLSAEQMKYLRAVHVISINLERIGDYCVNIAKQMGYLSSPRFLENFDYRESFLKIHQTISDILPTLHKANLSGALVICRMEAELDAMYKGNFDKIMIHLRIGRNVEDHITSLFIIRYLERIGDSLLNIGEALLFVIIGERIKIQQFQALQRNLTKSGLQGEVTDVDFQGIWGSRSGCRIARVEGKNAPQARDSIFKEGNLRKIRQEKINLECWNEIFPGLAPRVFSYQEEGENASLLTEFLAGCTLDEAIFNPDEEILENALFIFEQTLQHIWEQTLNRFELPTNMMRQVGDRMSSILQVHPELMRPPLGIGSLPIPSAGELIKGCMDIEARHPAPFSVFIHGDFNINNVIYNHQNQKVYFIDLHRSQHADYVQDVSVFLVSNFRLPAFDAQSRGRINQTIASFYAFAKSFARAHDDPGFDIRLGLGVARSFYTSTRFELNRSFAHDMYNRGLFLMERLTEKAPEELAGFSFPLEILYY